MNHTKQDNHDNIVSHNKKDNQEFFSEPKSRKHAVIIHKINNKITLCKHTIVNKKNISTKKSEPEGVITNKIEK